MKCLVLFLVSLATVFTLNSKTPDSTVMQQKPLSLSLSDTVRATVLHAAKDTVPMADSAFKADMKLLFTLIERNPTDTLINLIGDIIDGLSYPDNLLMSREAYEYFIHPNYMGQERVGVVIAEKYLLGKFIDILPDEERYSVSSYVKLIKPSLVGNRMPELHLYDLNGNPLDVERIKGFKILYFYTPTCSSCAIETPRLVEFLKSYKGLKINFIAVFSEAPGNDLNKAVGEWKAYIDRWFSFKNEAVELYNLWDPMLTSSFPLSYGVVSTPQLFFIDRRNVIAGRTLKTPQLQELTKETVASLSQTYKLINVLLMENANEGRLTYSGARQTVDKFVNLAINKPAEAYLFYKPEDFISEILAAFVDYLVEDYDVVDSKPMKFSKKDREKLANYIKKNYSSYLNKFSSVHE